MIIYQGGNMPVTPVTLAVKSQAVMRIGLNCQARYTPLRFYFHFTHYYYNNGKPCLPYMPTVHISEAVFREYVDREGGYDEAKQRVKDVVKEGLE